MEGPPSLNCFKSPLSNVLRLRRLRCVDFDTTNFLNIQLNAHFSFSRYAGYCPQAKFWHYGDTFGNTTAKCFQDRRTAKLSTSVMNDPGISGDGQYRFPTVYSNTPDLVLSARARTRERWCDAKKYSLFNEHERGREVQEFDKVSYVTCLTLKEQSRHSSGDPTFGGLEGRRLGEGEGGRSPRP